MQVNVLHNAMHLYRVYGALAVPVGIFLLGIYIMVNQQINFILFYSLQDWRF